MNESQGATRLAELKLVAASLRPELHRYASRMVASRFDAEDVVQDVMERAVLAVSTLAADVPLRPWLFRMAHNRAIDLMRSRRQLADVDVEDATLVSDEADDPQQAVLRAEAAEAAIGRFATLPITQRSIVILKDVLGHSLTEIMQLLDLSLQSVKAHLYRGRRALECASAPESAAATPSEATRRYAELFTQRDWVALRALLADEVRLVQHDKAVLTGCDPVGSTFFGTYARMDDWSVLVPACAEGIDIVAVFARPDAVHPAYVMRLDWQDGRIVCIHDYRYARYVVEGMRIDW